MCSGCVASIGGGVALLASAKLDPIAAVAMTLSASLVSWLMPMAAANSVTMMIAGCSLYAGMRVLAESWLLWCPVCPAVPGLEGRGAVSHY